MPAHSRRTFLATGSLGCAALTSTALAGLSTSPRAPRPGTAPDESYPTTSAARAQEFVGASHFNMERVEAMLAEDSGLAKAAWDWGFGDWETALGAASHTGQIAIVELLIAHGARPDLFTLATLDRIDAVRGILESVPNADALEGPHSISLYRHAAAGKAARVMEYLDAKGLNPPNPFETDHEAAKPLVGTYAWSLAEADRFEVAWFDRFTCLQLKRAGGVARNLIPLGDSRFSPAGARHVVLSFTHEGERATQLLVPQIGGVLSCARVTG